jgi:hypothetical protein
MIASTTASNIVRRLPSPLLRAVRRLRGRRARRELETWLAGVAPLFGGFENKRVLDVGSDVAGTAVDVIGFSRRADFSSPISDRSGSYGHHLWVTHGGRLYNYWNVILPPYCHLLLAKEEIESLLLDRGHGAERSR